MKARNIPLDKITGFGLVGPWGVTRPAEKHSLSSVSWVLGTKLTVGEKVFMFPMAHILSTLNVWVLTIIIISFHVALHCMLPKGSHLAYVFHLCIKTYIQCYLFGQCHQNGKIVTSPYFKCWFVFNTMAINQWHFPVFFFLSSFLVSTQYWWYYTRPIMQEP